MNPFALTRNFLVLLLAVPSLLMAQEWQLGAPVTVKNPGIVEVALLPEMHSQLQDGLDLKILGPDGQPRAFEFYWHEMQGETSLTLSQDTAQLENQIFIWQAKIAEKDRLLVKSLQINVLAADYIGKVDIFGRKEGVWLKFADKAALYTTGGITQGEIKIPEAVYEGFRLEFAAYAKKPVPIGKVVVRGEKKGKDYAEFRIPLQFKRKGSTEGADKGMVELTAALPGSGLYLQELELATATQFNGSWSLERQGIADGQKVFIPVNSGNLTGVEKGSAVLKITIGQTWKGNVFSLRLKSLDNYVSEVKGLVVTIRAPRLVFLAETAGIYTAQTGLNNKALIREYPSGERRENPANASFGSVKMNDGWKPESLIKLYELGGAAFDDNGYEWQSAINITKPGYYKFILHQRASLEINPRALRIARDGNQIPYFMDNGTMKEIPLGAKEEYDRKKNETIWHIELPQASARWKGLKLKASGIFNRKVLVERDMPQPVKGVVWTSLPWVNTSAKQTELFISLRGFPREESKIRLTIVHGDNKPIKLEELKAVYEAPAIYFLADTADGYHLYGGNATAGAPSYDMELIQQQLMKKEPEVAGLTGPIMLKSPGMANIFFKAFAKNNWGLYGVLGLLTIALMIIIVRLFPKSK